jgi:polyisoprenoid-binding protein YceI
MGKRWTKLAIAAPVAAVVLVTGGTWLYINVIRKDPPAPLTLDSGVLAGDPTSTTGAASTATTGSVDSTVTTAASTASSSGVDGTWKVSTGSQAGYRVKEVLFGQSAEAVGRTEAVTGEISVAGTKVASGSFSVDMTTVASSESRRDSQFRGRIMDVSSYPTSTFKLTQPIMLASVPADGVKVEVKATGDLTLHGTTKSVTITLAAQRAGATLKVAGSVPIVFADWGISNPSGGPATTEDHGSLEFLLVLAR